MLMGIGYSNSRDEDFFRNIVETIGIDEIVFGETYTKDGVSYQENEYIERYSDIEEFKDNNIHKILLPTYLPSGIETTNILVTDMKDKTEIIIGFNSLDLGFLIYPEKDIPQTIINDCSETITINNTTVHIIYLSDIGTYQMHFIYDNDYYYLVYTNKQELLKVIENMEE
jgi:hypothetical protein